MIMSLGLIPFQFNLKSMEIFIQYLWLDLDRLYFKAIGNLVLIG